MANEEQLQQAQDTGFELARQAVANRNEALGRRARALAGSSGTLESPGSLSTGPTRSATLEGPASGSRGVLVAEGDSWFDFPFNDVLNSLEDDHGYDVESVANGGDTVESMAYSGGQLEDFLRCLERAQRRGIPPKAVLLSAGGNDVAGDEFALLLNHARSPNPGLNDTIIEGVIRERLVAAYVTILTAVTAASETYLGRALPILIHGYARPVPDGRGVFGIPFLPGPWLQPGFHSKGFGDLAENARMVGELIDRFNDTLREISERAEFPHVHYVDLRSVLSNELEGKAYREDWSDELHPTRSGFDRVANAFAEALERLQ
ncbi:MAG: SGNH/GDSL hydrolase family protein [Acidobacteriota bacterium]